MNTMRSPKHNAAGTSGQSYVKAQFEELEWGAVLNPEHDLGTDLLLMARDARRWDLGALVGAQVKNWSLDFAEPDTHDSQEGWWFRSDEEHFVYWLTHRIPHLQIYYDKTAKISYWVHIQRSAVISTGVGRKIFVPKSQTVDADHLDELIAVALSAPVGENWEGSAWAPGQLIPQTSQYRYSMIVPRLVAPHGNDTPVAISAAEGVALLTAVRLSELNPRYQGIESLLDPDISAANDDLSWRFYAALHIWIRDGEHKALEELVSADMPAELRAAHRAAIAAALYEEGLVLEAITILEKALGDFDDYNTVDHAWLSMHLARNLVQVGEADRASKLALQASSVGAIAPSDPTAKALAGVAAEMIFSLAGWGSGDVQATIRATDNAASWWRSQAMKTGLAKYLESSFNSWADDQTVTFGASDQTWAKLRSASLISGFSADAGGWNSAASLLAQYILLSGRDAEQEAGAIELLRIAGASKQLKLAVSRSLEHGPTAGLELATSKVQLNTSLRTSLKNDLDLIGRSAPILAPEKADEVAAWLLAEIADPETRASRLRLQFLYANHLVETLSRVYVACSEPGRSAIRAHVGTLPVVSDQSLAHEYARVIDAVAVDDWEIATLDLMRTREDGDNWELKNEIESVIAQRDPEFRANLVERIGAGEVSALASWGRVTDLPEHAAAGMIKSSADAVAVILQSSRGGAFSYGEHSALNRLVLLNVWFPDVADWEACVAAIAEPSIGPHDLSPGLLTMIAYADRIPADISARIRADLYRIAGSPSGRNFADAFMGKKGVQGDASLLIASLYGDDFTEAELLELLAGSSEQVVAAVRILIDKHEESAFGTLLVLAHGVDAKVRTNVAAGLVKWIAQGTAEEKAAALLSKMLERPGIRLAGHVASALKRAGRSKARSAYSPA